jgi:hypothetical protein
MAYECSIHNTLWQSSASSRSSTMTNARLIMLQRSLSASETFACTLLAARTSSLNALTFPVWSGWFYSTILVMKIVVLQQTGDASFARMNSVPHTVGDLLPQEHAGSTTRKITEMTSSLEHSSLRDSISSLEEMTLVSLLEAFIQKLEAGASQYANADRIDPIKPYLRKVATLQGALLVGIKKMTCVKPDDINLQQPEPSFSTLEGSVSLSSGSQDQQSLLGQYPDQGYHQPSFDFTYLDHATAFVYQSGQQLPMDDFLWNMVMNDGNLFTM